MSKRDLKHVHILNRDNTHVDKDNPLSIDQSNGVPPTFTELTSNTGASLISKGNLNKVRFFPRILNEHVESSREIQGVVSSGNIVGQVFKASQDNITALMLTLESAAGISLDTFESYANSTALRAVWIKGGTNDANLEETIVKTGNKAMSLPCGLLNDSWVNTISLTDYTNFTGSFDAYFTKEFNKLKVSVFIGDGTNTKSFQLIQADKEVWAKFEVNEAAMSEDGGGTTNVTAITKIGFRVDDKESTHVCIIDNLAATPPPGEIDIKLWDMGASIPESAITSIDDGAQYNRLGVALSSEFTLSLKGGKRLYHIYDFVAGPDKAIPDNETLNVGNYYIVELVYVDTNINVYGPDTAFTTNYYTNGYAFTASDESTAITAIGPNSDLMFGIFSTQDAYFVSVTWRFNAEPNGDSSINAFFEDTNMTITDVVVDHEVSPEQAFTTDLSLRPAFLGSGGKLEFYYNDDHTDSVTRVIGEAKFLFEPPVING